MNHNVLQQPSLQQILQEVQNQTRERVLKAGPGIGTLAQNSYPLERNDFSASQTH